MTACAPWLSAELAVVQPRGVVVLGVTAGRAIFGRSFKVTARRGQILTWPETPEGVPQPEWVVATTHPSAVLRSPDRDAAFAAMVADLKLAADTLG